MVDVALLRSRMRRLLLRHRRILSALLAALSVLIVVQTVAPDAPALSSLVVATRDVPAGVRLSGADVRVAQVPPSLVPSGAARAVGDVLGQVAAGPVRAGEPLTDRRLVGQSLLAGYPAGMVAAPVRIQDASAVDLLQPGDAITVYAAGGSTPYAAAVVGRARVVTVPHVSDDAQQGGLVVLAVTAQQAAALAQAAATAPLSVALLR